MKTTDKTYDRFLAFCADRLRDIGMLPTKHDAAAHVYGSIVFSSTTSPAIKRIEELYEQMEQSGLVTAEGRFTGRRHLTEAGREHFELDRICRDEAVIS
jgi:hypothetical protein